MIFPRVPQIAFFVRNHFLEILDLSSLWRTPNRCPLRKLSFQIQVCCITFVGKVLSKGRCLSNRKRRRRRERRHRISACGIFYTTKNSSPKQSLLFFYHQLFPRRLTKKDKILFRTREVSQVSGEDCISQGEILCLRPRRRPRLQFAKPPQ